MKMQNLKKILTEEFRKKGYTNVEIEEIFCKTYLMSKVKDVFTTTKNIHNFEEFYASLCNEANISFKKDYKECLKDCRKEYEKADSFEVSNVVQNIYRDLENLFKDYINENDIGDIAKVLTEYIDCSLLQLEFKL